MNQPAPQVEESPSGVVITTMLRASHRRCRTTLEDYPIDCGNRDPASCRSKGLGIVHGETHNPCFILFLERQSS